MAFETYQVTINGNLAGQFVQTVQHVLCDIATPVNPFVTALNLIQDINSGGVLQKWCAILPANYLITSLRAKKISGGGGPTAILTQDVLGYFTGLRVVGISSTQVNPVIVWIGTDAPDKTGRVFLPGVSEDDISEMILDSGLVTEINLFIAAWIAGGTLGGVDSWAGAIFRRAQDGPPPVAASTDLIAYGQLSPVIGTQRRRLHPV